MHTPHSNRIAGDVSQIRPVTGIPLAQAALIKGNKGGELFNGFSFYELTQQMRAPKDKQHADNVRDMVSGVRKVSREAMQRAVSRVKVWTAADIEKDPSWLDAPMSVATNRARCLLNYERMLHFAKRTHAVILKFRNPLVCNGLSEQIVERLYASFRDELWTYFVVRCPAFLKEENLNVEMQVANSCKLKLHSITFDPETWEAKGEEILDSFRRAIAGQMIEVPTPLSANVEVMSVDPAKWPADATLIPGKVVIPLLVRDNGTPEKLVPGRCKGKSRGKNTSCKLEYRKFPFELGFACTYHKQQSRTLDKEILVVSKRLGGGRIRFPHFYVGYSRTRSDEDLRFFPLGPGEDFKHIIDLKPEAYVLKWLEHIDFKSHRFVPDP